MREIKFRAWDKHTQRMWHSDGTLLPMKITFTPNYIYCEGEASYDPEANYIMQYTGLEDKNGKEIYEGDIIKKCCDYDSDFNNALSYIVYDDSNMAFGFELIRGHEWSFYMPDGPNWSDYELEVIGNIYQNRELLEEQK